MCHLLDISHRLLLSADVGQTSNEDQSPQSMEDSQPKDEFEEPQMFKERTLPDDDQLRQNDGDEYQRNNGTTTTTTNTTTTTTTTTTANSGHDGGGGFLVIHIRSGDIFDPEGQGKMRPTFGQVISCLADIR